MDSAPKAMMRSDQKAISWKIACHNEEHKANGNRCGVREHTDIRFKLERLRNPFSELRAPAPLYINNNPLKTEFILNTRNI
jgi:hypothetical protein